MKIAFVSFGNEINCIGGRRVAKIARQIEPSTDIFLLLLIYDQY